LASGPGAGIAAERSGVARRNRMTRRVMVGGKCGYIVVSVVRVMSDVSLI